jgi:hypothetical protein
MFSSAVLSLITLGLLSQPAVAHQVQIQDTVGATLHIEPNDIPLAGTPTEVWFALTQVGGTVIPLNRCDCSLTLYDGGENVIATPDLFPLSAEGYREIPGASVTFPEVGTYELVLAGTPLEAAEFTPFELRFEVVVAGRAPDTRSAPEPTPAEAQSAAPSATNLAGDTPEASPVVETSQPPAASWFSNRLVIWGGAVLVVGILAGIWGGGRSPGGKS